jgi:hypothetical protein
METEIKVEQRKVVIMNRKPPGDRWVIPPDVNTIYNSLTDALEEYFQKNGTTDFYIEARNGTVSVVVTEEKEVEKPIQKYSLYGEY